METILHPSPEYVCLRDSARERTEQEALAARRSLTELQAELPAQSTFTTSNAQETPNSSPPPRTLGQ
ncbi:hypothetical protein GN956_G15637 [Arapaima gigas]